MTILKPSETALFYLQLLSFESFSLLLSFSSSALRDRHNLLSSSVPPLNLFTWKPIDNIKDLLQECVHSLTGNAPKYLILDTETTKCSVSFGPLAIIMMLEQNHWKYHDLSTTDTKEEYPEDLKKARKLFALSNSGDQEENMSIEDCVYWNSYLPEETKRELEDDEVVAVKKAKIDGGDSDDDYWNGY